MDKSLVSIIIPVYNVEKFLPDCFKSLENQSYENLQFVFINDGSKDNSQKLIQEFCLKHKNSKLINQTNMGICKTRNVGFEHADGKYLYFMDPDDIMHPQAISHQVELMESNNVDLVCCEIKNIKEQKTYDKVNFKKLNKKNTCYSNKDKMYSRYIGSRKGATNKLFKKELFLKIEGFPKIADENISFGEDMNIVCKYLLKCNSVCFDNNVTYYWRFRMQSETTKSFNVGLISALDCLNPFYVLKESEYPKTYTYLKSSKSITAFYLLFRIKNSDYYDNAKVEHIYTQYKLNLPYIWKSKYYPWYVKYLFWCPKPISWIIYKKIIKRGKKKVA